MSVMLRNAIQSQLHLVEYIPFTEYARCKSVSFPLTVLGDVRAGLRDYEGKGIMTCIGRCLARSDRR